MCRGASIFTNRGDFHVQEYECMIEVPEHLDFFWRFKQQKARYHYHDEEIYHWNPMHSIYNILGEKEKWTQMEIKCTKTESKESMTS
jgi:hypothetical protein